MRAHRVLIGLLLVLCCGPFATVHALSEDTKTSLIIPTQWAASGSPAPEFDVPTDGYIDLGFEFREGVCDKTVDGLSTLAVAVEVDGSDGTPETVEGAVTLESARHARWTPAQDLVPNRNYRVKVVASNSVLIQACVKALSSDLYSDFTFTTGPGTAVGAILASPVFEAALTEHTCGTKELVVRFEPTQDHPYVSYTAAELLGARPDFVRTQGVFSVSLDGASIDTCLDIEGTHDLTGASSTARVCATEATQASRCDEGCASSQPGSPLGGLAGALVGLVLMFWRRRRGVLVP